MFHCLPVCEEMSSKACVLHKLGRRKTPFVFNPTYKFRIESISDQMCHTAVIGITFWNVIPTLPVWSPHLDNPKLVSKRNERIRAFLFVDIWVIEKQYSIHTHAVILALFKIIPKFENVVRFTVYGNNCRMIQNLHVHRYFMPWFN